MLCLIWWSVGLLLREFYRKIIITKDLKVIFNLVCCLLSTKSKRNASLHLCEFKIKFLIWHKKPDILLKFAYKIKSSSSAKSSLFCFLWNKGEWKQRKRPAAEKFSRKINSKYVQAKTIFLSAAGWGHFWKWNENSKHPRLFARVVLVEN